MQSSESNDPTHESADTSDRRREPRYEASSVGDVTILNPTSVPYPAQVINVSKSGLCFQSELELERGIRVKVSFGETLAFGEVRWCRQVDDCWFEAGIAIDNLLPRDLVTRIHRAAEPAT